MIISVITLLHIHCLFALPFKDFKDILFQKKMFHWFLVSDITESGKFQYSKVFRSVIVWFYCTDRIPCQIMRD
jgi:hypothetical protein